MGKINDLEWSRQCFYNPKLPRSSGAAYAFNHLSYRDQKKLLKEIPAHFHKLLYIENALPHTYSSLFTKVSFVPEKEMAGLGCMVMQLLPYRREINKFVALKERYEQHLLLSDFEECERILDEIDHICLSLWSVENRLFIKNFNEGTEAALAYKDKIADISSPLAVVMISLFWSKIESKYSLSPVEQKLMLTIRSIGFSSQTSAYFKYNTLKYQYDYKYLDCIWFALMNSAIDIYELMLDMMVAKTKEFKKDDLAQVRTVLADLGKQIDDRRIKIQNIAYGFVKSELQDSDHNKLLYLYNTYNYLQVKNSAPEYISSHVDDIDIIDIYVKSCLYLKDKDINIDFLPAKSFVAQIIGYLFQYLKKGPVSQLAFAKLSVIANQMSSLRIGKCLHEKLMCYESLHKDLEKYKLLNGFDSFSEVDKIENDYKNTIGPENVPIFLKQKAVALAYEFLDPQHRDSEIIRLYNESYTINPLIVSKIDAKPLLERHDKILNVLSLDALETSVFYALTGAPKHMVYHFFKKYIKAQKTQKPSDLILEYTENFTPIMENFFYKVCTQEILKLYIRMFPTSDSVLEERLKILTNLSKIRGRRRYLPEITRIKRRQRTNKRVQDLDQRMIYVDENAIKETELAEVEKQFRVYIETESKLETKQYLLEADEMSVDVINKGKMKMKTEKVIYKNLLFRQMFLDIRKKFLTSYNNGLDFYLSTRIRHGTLLTQLRSAFEENNIITNKQGGSYKDNTIIADRVLGLSGEERIRVIEKLRAFSKEIDDYILHIKNDVVQVQAMDLPVQYPEAAFNYDYVINENDIALLYIDKISQIDDYIEFVEIVFAYLWERTEMLLEAMREILDSVKLHLAGKIISLENDVIEIVGENNRLDGFIEKSNKARDGMIQSVEKVKKWFYRGKCDDDDFQIRDVVDACKESVSIHRNTDFELSVNDDSTTWIKGEYFRKVSDLFLIFFNNILDYKKDVDIDMASSVSIDEDENLIEVTISNRLADSDILPIQKYVEEMKGKLGNPEYNQYASKEKGSGHFKAYNMIHSMLPYDKEAFTMNVDDGLFVVKFKIDTTYIRAYEDTNC